MKIIQISGASGSSVDINLIEEAEWHPIADLSGNDIDAALKMLGRFMNAGKLLVKPYIPSKTFVIDPIVGVKNPHLMVPKFLTQFRQDVWTMSAGKFIRLMGVGETEQEAKESFLGWFIGDDIHATAFNKYGPVYFLGEGKGQKGYQLEREMMFIPIRGGSGPVFN